VDIYGTRECWPVLCMDRLRLSRRAHALWMAVDHSNFGIVDMCGFPKDNSSTTRPGGRSNQCCTCSALELEGREGDEIPVWVHSNLDERELLLNGKSLGKKKFRDSPRGVEVRYEPGTIRLMAGKTACSRDRRASAPHRPCRGIEAHSRSHRDRRTRGRDCADGFAVDSQGRAVA